MAHSGSTATACVDQTEDLSPQSSPFRDAWIGKDVRNKRVSERVLFPSPAPNEFKHLRQSFGVGVLLSGSGECSPDQARRRALDEACVFRPEALPEFDAGDEPAVAPRIPDSCSMGGRSAAHAACSPRPPQPCSSGISPRRGGSAGMPSGRYPSWSRTADRPIGCPCP